MKISRKSKSELYKVLVKELYSNGIPDDRNWIDNFLNEIWDLRAMPSEDPKFSDAYGDVFQHIVNNTDWEVDYLFIDRLKLLDVEDKFYIQFLERIVYPNIEINDDEVMKLVLIINSYLKKDGLILSASGYNNEERIIYSLGLLKNTSGTLDIPPNTIPFFIDKSNGRATKKRYMVQPIQFPSFLLVADNWNDYGWETTFELLFCINNEKKISIGFVKITNGNDKKTREVINSKFNILSDDFYSLGQHYEYYENLKKFTGVNFKSVLYALKDTAFFSEIHERVELDTAFHTSLLRNNDSERLLREVKYKIYNYDLTDLYSFDYQFKPKYSANDIINIKFEFDNSLNSLNRIYAIIGKNGAGKTQFITSLPQDISKENDEVFSPKTPLFSKVITVSYSTFDTFEIPKKTSSFNYVYCGLFNENREQLTLNEQEMRFHETWKNIKRLERIPQWGNILSHFIDGNILDKIIIEDDDNELTVSINGFNEIKNHLSSGQKIILYIISEIISNIRYDSLLLFDEPETHLHPNAISMLINTIFQLVKEFQSFCILTTHSPIVIQQLFSKNVYVMEKHESNIPSIRKIGVESFGENLTVLTEEVFGTKEVGHQYKAILAELVREGKSYEEISEILTSNETQLSLNARLYLKSILKG